MKLPNLLQNLFGEGVLSASFIPVYVRLMEEKREDEARRVAGAVASMLALIVSVLVLLGVLAAPLLVDVFAGRVPRREARGLASTWCASCSPAPASWCCRPGAWAC
jgi:peptidoglycan biosynthesis protein MviN/MurJ (putative lipid II flippase)